jgi:hypothetical protein
MAVMERKAVVVVVVVVLRVEVSATLQMTRQFLKVDILSRTFGDRQGPMAWMTPGVDEEMAGGR